MPDFDVFSEKNFENVQLDHMEFKKIETVNAKVVFRSSIIVLLEI